MGNRERLERQNFSGVAALPQKLTVPAIVCADVNDQVDRVVLNLCQHPRIKRMGNVVAVDFNSQFAR